MGHRDLASEVFPEKVLLSSYPKEELELLGNEEGDGDQGRWNSACKGLVAHNMTLQGPKQLAFRNW